MSETRAEQEAAEILTVSGTVEAVSEKEGRYGIRIGEQWFGGFGTCPVWKGQACVVDYRVRGQYRNVVRVRAEGPPARPARADGSPEIPVAVRNYLTPGGWEQAFLTADERELIQADVRSRNARALEESIADAQDLLAMSGIPKAVTPRNVVTLAALLADRRIVHVSRVYDEFLRAKIAAERAARTAPEGESPSVPAGGGGDA